MVPTSDSLEAFFSRLRDIDASLARMAPSAKVTRGQALAALAALAKDWLRSSASLRGLEGIDLADFKLLDESMQDVFRFTTSRSRASSYRFRLNPFIQRFTQAVLVPLVRHEANPAQVAARFVEAAFDGAVTEDEAAYIAEAGQCVTVRSHRAAVIMLWAAGIARIHQSVMALGFGRFNRAVSVTAAKKGSPYSRFHKPPEIQSPPELQLVRDFDLLVVGMELWGYDMAVFDELHRLLGQRNGAAHPGGFRPDVYAVQNFAQNLRSYLFDCIGPTKTA